MPEEDGVRAVIENIAETFSRLDLAGWLDNFHAPRMIVLPDATFSPVDATEAERLFNPILESLRARGFTRSTLDSCSVQLLTPLTAVASASFTRFAGDEVLERLGATYVLQKRDGHWGVLLVTPHGPDISLVQN